jgi:hypothetical protein
VVIGNFPSCAGEWYEEKFHTCHGLISNSTNRQFIASDNQSLQKSIERYQPFPILVLINKRQGGEWSSSALSKTVHRFKEIYSSGNYALYFQDTSYSKCSKSFKFSCVKNAERYFISLPETAFRYYYPHISFKLNDEIVSATIELDTTQDYKRTIFMLLYVLIYSYCIRALLSSGARHRK